MTKINNIMFYKRIILVLIVILFYGCVARRSSPRNLHEDFLEKQLLMLKNQAFCDCVNKALQDAGATLTPQDGSNYMQISQLDDHYWNDPNLERLINIWNTKEYISYIRENKLYFMRCLDFYNSQELANYIDSVRNIEKKTPTY